jgi:hypothetical protein
MARVGDWLVGAAGMTLVLVLGVAIGWWVVSSPAGDAGPVPSPSPSPPVGVDRSPDREPPADLRRDEVWLSDLALDAGTVVTAGSLLREVRAVGQGVVTGPDGLVAARVTVDATVPFQVVADELGDDTVVRAADGGQAMVVRTVTALGRELRVTATGTVEVVAGNIVVEPRSIDLGGPGFLSGPIATVVRGLVTIEHDVEGLPEGLRLQHVTVTDGGFRVHLRGEDVELVP